MYERHTLQLLDLLDTYTKGQYICYFENLLMIPNK
jgi:hypothetical protein